jgi:hypothetical protein
MPVKVKLAKRPEYVALEIMEVGKAVTPSEIDKHVGTGAYASKYMSFLKRDGYTIQVNKDGRSVVSYTLVAKPAVEPAHASGRATTPKVEKVAKAKKAKEKAVKAPKKEKPAKAEAKKPEKKAAKKAPAGFVLPAKKKVKAEKPAAEKPAKEDFAPTQEMTSFAVDSDWDDIPETINTSDLA